MLTFGVHVFGRKIFWADIVILACKLLKEKEEKEIESI
jgi:hypothetical protein